MGNDTDCTPEVQRHDQAYKGGVPVSKLVRNTMVIASFNGAESDEVRILWCSMRFAANAENIRTKGHKNKRNNAYVFRAKQLTQTLYLLSLCSRVSGKSHRAPQYPDSITFCAVE